MLVERITVLRGPNYWSAKHHNLIVLTIDLQDFENVATHLIPGFPGRLAAAFPALAKVPASEGADRHLLNAVAEGTTGPPSSSTPQ
jgi:cyanophycin synthetase